MRLKDEALCVKINNLNISEVTEKSIDIAQKWFTDLEGVLNEKEKNFTTYIERD